jgi:hypothetical protein
MSKRPHTPVIVRKGATENAKVPSEEYLKIVF